MDDTTAIEDALKSFKQRLNADELRRLGEVKDAETLISRLQDRLPPQAVEHTSNTEKLFVNGLKRAGTMASALAPAVPEVSTVVFGAFDLISERSASSTDAHKMLTMMLDSFCRAVPSFQRWETTFADYPGMRLALVRFYEESLEFLRCALDFSSRRSNRRFGSFLGGEKYPFELQQHLDKLTDSSETITKLLVPATVGLHHEWQLEIREKLKSIKAQSTVKLPCRVLPYPSNPGFRGREVTLQQIETRLVASAGEQISLTVHGIGGVGKTQVVLKYVSRHLEEYPAIFWMAADTVEKLSQSFMSACQRLGLVTGALASDLDAAVADLKHWLANTSDRWLLIFDNADDPSILDRFWPPGRHGTVIVTSRDPASISMSKSSIALSPMGTEEALTTFTALLGQENRGLNASDRPLAMNILQLIGNLPLAINQVASYITECQCTLADFLDIYREQDEATEPFESIKPDMPNRFYEHSLSTVWKISLSSTQESSIAMLHILSFFDADGIPESLLRNGSRATDDLAFLSSITSYTKAKRELLRKGLATHCSIPIKDHTTDDEQNASGVTVHRLIQDVVFKTQNVDGRSKSVQRAATILSKMFPVVEKGQRLNLVRRWPDCALYISHVTAFCERCRINSLDIPVLLIDVMLSAGWYLQERGNIRPSLAMLTLGDRLCEEHNIHDWTKSKIQTALAAIRLDTQMFDYAKAYQLNQQVLSWTKQNFDAGSLEVAVASNNVANALIGLKRYDDAIELYKACMAIANRFEDIDRRNNALFHFNHNCARAYEFKGLPNDALALHMAFGDIHGNGLRSEMSPDGARNLYAVGNCYLLLGNMEGLKCHIRAFEVREKMFGSNIVTAVSLRKIATILYENQLPNDTEMLQNAAVAARQSCDILRDCADGEYDLAWSLFEYSKIEQRRGHDEPATQLFDEAIEIWQKTAGEKMGVSDPASIGAKMKSKVNFYHY